jgi:hypothetical protein
VAVIAAVHGPTRVAARGRLRLYSAASGDDVDVSGACSSNRFDIAFRKKRKFVHQTLYMGCRQHIIERCPRLPRKVRQSRFPVRPDVNSRCSRVRSLLMTKKQEECREDDSAAQEDFDLHRLIEQSEAEKHGERQPDEVDQDQERRIRELHRPGEGELRGKTSRPLDG